jgi:hypothetical protein
LLGEGCRELVNPRELLLSALVGERVKGVKRSSAALALLIGCSPASRPLPTPTHPPPRVARPAVPPAKSALPPGRADAFREPIELPGCDADGVAALKKQLEEIDRKLHPPYADDDDDASAAAAAPVSDAEIAPAIVSAWRHPCVAHLAMVFPPPAKPQPESLRAAWDRGLGRILLAMAGALYVRDGKRYFVAPPAEPEPFALTELGAQERARIAPWLCPESQKDCGHAGSAIVRAEESFDREEQLAHRWRGVLVGSPARELSMPNAYLSTDHDCVPSERGNDEAPPLLTPFERFAVCVASSAPRTWRYPKSLRLRTREKGWLVLRGRRGHYEFADEVRAYDLATGAAYVAKSSSALVLGGASVDFAAVDAKRKPETTVGTVSRDQVRELAFVLGTAPVLRPARSEILFYPVPPDLPVAFSPGRFAARAPLDVTELSWGSSAHTHLAWSLVDEGTVIAEGKLMWPTSFKPAENQADDLVRVLEGGLEPGCAPARLPRGVAHGNHGKVSAIDADPAKQADVFEILANTLDGLGDRTCPRTAHK